MNRMWEPVLYVRCPTSPYKCLAKVIYARLADAAFCLVSEGWEEYGVYQIQYLRRALTYLLLIPLQASGIIT